MAAGGPHPLARGGVRARLASIVGSGGARSAAWHRAVAAIAVAAAHTRIRLRGNVWRVRRVIGARVNPIRVVVRAVGRGCMMPVLVRVLHIAGVHPRPMHEVIQRFPRGREVEKTYMSSPVRFSGGRSKRLSY